MSRSYNDDGYPRGGSDEYHDLLRAETRQQKPYAVTLTAAVKTQVVVTATDEVEAWVTAEEVAAANPPPLPAGMRYDPDPFDRPWTATLHSGDVVEILEPAPTADEQTSGDAA